MEAYEVMGPDGIAEDYYGHTKEEAIHAFIETYDFKRSEIKWIKEI